MRAYTARDRPPLPRAPRALGLAPIYKLALALAPERKPAGPAVGGASDRTGRTGPDSALGEPTFKLGWGNRQAGPWGADGEPTFRLLGSSGE
jgi:hypothetical protein